MLAQHDQRHDHAGGFKIQMMHIHEISLHDLDQCIQTVKIRTAGTDAHQGIHIRRTMQQRFAAADKKDISDQNDQCCQNKLNEGEIERMCFIMNDLRQRQGNRQHVAHADI